jgi:hypothetical protein
MSRYGGGRDTTEGYKRIDVSFLRERGYLVPGAFFTLSWSRNDVQTGWIQCRTNDEAVILSYRHRRGEWDDWKSEEYPVWLSYTPCNYGGERPWFLCPARGCGRRVAILYRGTIFACRLCHQLVYESQREAPHYRLLRKAQKLSERLGGTGCIDDMVFRPKGMHQGTFERLQCKYEYAARRVDLLAGDLAPAKRSPYELL